MVKLSKNNIEIKQIIELNDNTLNTVTEWMYNWWGKEDGYTFEEIKCFMSHSLQKSRLPQTYGIFVDNKIVGISTILFIFTMIYYRYNIEKEN